MYEIQPNCCNMYKGGCKWTWGAIAEKSRFFSVLVDTFNYCIFVDVHCFCSGLRTHFLDFIVLCKSATMRCTKPLISGAYEKETHRQDLQHLNAFCANLSYNILLILFIELIEKQ